MANAIKYLYSQFLLRDVLSFITPGAIVVLTASLLFLPEPCLTQRLETLFKYSTSMHWLLYIPLFGFFFLVGFAVDSFGKLFNLIGDSPHDKWPFCRKQRWQILTCKWTKDKDNLWWNSYYKWMLDFWEATNRDESARQGRERSVVIKQMSGNGLLAIFIAGIFFGLNFCPVSWVKFPVAIVILLIMLLALLWGHRVYVLLQYAREKVIIDDWTRNHFSRGV